MPQADGVGRSSRPSGPRPWRRGAVVKTVLIALVMAGRIGVGAAFVLDTIVSVLVLAYGWRLARR